MPKETNGEKQCRKKEPERKAGIKRARWFGIAEAFQKCPFDTPLDTNAFAGSSGKRWIDAEYEIATPGNSPLLREVLGYRNLSESLSLYRARIERYISER